MIEHAEYLLFNALKGDGLRIVEDILQVSTKSKVNIVDKEMGHPFAKVQSVAMAELLFSYGDEIHTLHPTVLKTDNTGPAAVKNAVRTGSKELVNVFFKHGIKMTKKLLYGLHTEIYDVAWKDKKNRK